MTGRPQDVDLVSDGFTATGKLRGTLWAAAQIGRPLTEEEQSYVTEILDDRKMNEIRARIEFEVKDPATAEAQRKKPISRLSRRAPTSFTIADITENSADASTIQSAPRTLPGQIRRA